MIKNKSDFYISLGLFAICAILAWQISLLPATSSAAEFFGPASFPKGVTFLLFCLSVILCINSIRCAGKPASWPPRALFGRVLAMICLILCYILGFIYGGSWAYDMMMPEGTGFCIATFLFLSLAQALMGHRKALHVVGISIIITGCLYVIFALLFKVPLP